MKRIVAGRVPVVAMMRLPLLATSLTQRFAAVPVWAFLRRCVLCLGMPSLVVAFIGLTTPIASASSTNTIFQTRPQSLDGGFMASATRATPADACSTPKSGGWSGPWEGFGTNEYGPWTASGTWSISFTLSADGSFTGFGENIGTAYFPDYDLTVGVGHTGPVSGTLLGCSLTFGTAVGESFEGTIDGDSASGTWSGDGEGTWSGTFAGFTDPPVVATDLASPAHTSATLNGTVFTDGETVSECYFEYGPTASYGSKVPCDSLPTEDNPAVSAEVTGLTEGATYHYRLIAKSTGGIGFGDDKSFVAATLSILATTPGAPTQVSATASNASATVSWTDPASNGGSTITSYTASTPGHTCKVSGASAASCTVSGLTNGNTYTFTVAATNSIGTGPASSPSNAVTPPKNAPAPSGVPPATFGTPTSETVHAGSPTTVTE